MFRIKRLVKSFSYALKGLVKVFREENNFKVQTFAGILVIFLAYYLKISRLEWLSLIIVVGLVVLTETLNSAVERVSDVLKPRINTYVKEIKDIMAAAVMISAVMAIVVGLIIFLPYI